MTSRSRKKKINIFTKKLEAVFDILCSRDFEISSQKLPFVGYEKMPKFVKDIIRT